MVLKFLIYFFGLILAIIIFYGVGYFIGLIYEKISGKSVEKGKVSYYLFFTLAACGFITRYIYPSFPIAAQFILAIALALQFATKKGEY